MERLKNFCTPKHDQYYSIVRVSSDEITMLRAAGALVMSIKGFLKDEEIFRLFPSKELFWYSRELSEGLEDCCIDYSYSNKYYETNHEFIQKQYYYYRDENYIAVIPRNIRQCEADYYDPNETHCFILDDEKLLTVEEYMKKHSIEK